MQNEFASPEDPSDPAHKPLKTGQDNRRELLTVQARRVRATIGTKRSDKLLRLFDFLLARTLEGRPPSEMEIANEAFSIGPTVDGPQDATVRVYVHRLRKSLELSQADMAGPRLFIPKGEYALMLEEESEDAGSVAAEAVPDADGKPQDPRRRWWWWFVGLVVAGLALNALVWWGYARRDVAAEAPAVVATTLWGPLAGDSRPVTVVMGDYYLYGEKPDGEAGAPRLIRNPAINAREDLDLYLMARPEERARITDSDKRYLPSSAVAALGDVYKALRDITRTSGRKLSLLPVSQLTPDILKSSDIVYIGQLGGLGTLLRNPLFQASGFQVGETYDELIDSASGRRFRSDGGLVLADERMARRDFGYLASLPGPSGNHIVVIAGTRDPALRQMAEYAANPAKLAALTGAVPGGRHGFEALYQVRTLGSLNVNGQLLLARPLRSGDIWDMSKPSQRFPNDDFEGDGAAN